LLFDRKHNGNFEWDATYNGFPLPSASYWYVIHLGNGEKFKGVVAVKR
jgi:gliding motility-associated-like protein